MRLPSITGIMDYEKHHDHSEIMFGNLISNYYLLRIYPVEQNESLRLGVIGTNIEASSDLDGTENSVDKNHLIKIK